MFEVAGDVDVGRQAEAEDGNVFTVKQEGAIDHVEEELDVTAPWKVRGHVIEDSLSHLNINSRSCKIIEY